MKDGFNNAVYLGTIPDFTRTRDNVQDHYFAYPINYNGKKSYVFCRAMQDNNKNRLYVHEVFVADNIQNEGNTLQTAASKPHGGIALYKAILSDVLSAAKVENNYDTPQLSHEEKSMRNSEGSQLFPEFPKKPFTVEEVNDEMAQAAKGVAREMNVGGNVDVLTSTDGLTGRKRNAKGWYDPRTGRITIVLPNHTSAEDVKRTIFHEAAAHMGLRQLVGEENFDTFIDNIHNNAEKGVKAAIDELAQTKYNGDTRRATEEYMANLAEDGEFKKPENQSFFKKVKGYLIDLLKKAGIDLGFKVDDNDLRYILWRSWKNLTDGPARDIHQMAEDAAMQEHLQQTPEARQRHDDEVYFREVNDSIKDIVEQTKADLAKLNEEKRNRKAEAVKAIGGRLSELSRAMREQRAYDLHTVASITDMAKTMLKNGLLNNLTNTEASRLLSVVNNVHGKADIKKYVQKVLDMMVDNQNKNLNAEHSDFRTIWKEKS